MNIAFIGLGNMGAPMASNLAEAGLAVTGFDLSEHARDVASASGLPIGRNLASSVEGATVVITMLPAGRHVRSVYEDVAGNLASGSLLIDCSTIDVTSARELHALAARHGHLSVDAPVSGGVMGAANASLTFMAGGSNEALEAAEIVLQPMAGRIVRCGDGGAGQAAKACNNMLLAISMVGASEAFNLGRSLGLEDQALFDVISTASGQCWSVNTYCPVPGPVPTSPANNGYRAGFSVDLMVKDMGLAAEAAGGTDTATPLGDAARALYEEYSSNGEGDSDFSGIIRMLANRSR